MKHTGFKLFAIAAAFAVGLLSQARASTVTWTFQENGSNMDLGVWSAFTQSGYTVTAYGFTMAGVGSDLFSKINADPTETGLGMVNDVGNDHEIDNAHFVQIDSHISPPASIGSIWLGSIQLNETGAIYGSNTLGSLGTQLTTLGSNGSFSLSSYIGTYRYFGVTDIGTGESNTLVTALSASVVPDGGTTSLLLGLGLISLAIIRRKR